MYVFRIQSKTISIAITGITYRGASNFFGENYLDRGGIVDALQEKQAFWPKTTCTDLISAWKGFTSICLEQ